MPQNRSRAAIFLVSLFDGAILGAMAGAPVGAAVGVFVLLRAPFSVGEVLFAVVFGGIGGLVWGTFLGLVAGVGVGLLRGILFLCVRVRRLNRRGARVISALASAVGGLLVGVWQITVLWPVILFLWALAVPLAVWRAPYILEDELDWRGRPKVRQDGS